MNEPIIGRRRMRVPCLLAGLILLTACGGAKQEREPEEKDFSLKEAFGNKILVGIALDPRQTAGADSAAIRLMKHHFNFVVAADGNMTREAVRYEEERYDFAASDSLVAFGEANGMTVVGRSLVPQPQCVPQLFVDEKGKRVTPEVLKQRMKDRISTIVSRYKGRIHGWNVADGAFAEDGSYRTSPFYEILGEEFIPYAFRCAHEADPDAELYYNDYDMNAAGRRKAVAALARSLKEQGIRIDAVGMPADIGMNPSAMNMLEGNMSALADAGVKVMLTEWNANALRELAYGKKAVFDGFNYSADGLTAGNDTENNPILPGCYPDPSICRVGEDYYLVNSSFAYFPGVPIWHSTDLKSWKRLGYVLNRPSQLMLKEGLPVNAGIYAPDIKYNPHNRRFYMITTAVGGGGNFFVTTDDPKRGEWSDPTFLPEVGGIDPSFLFDDDGKAYIVANGQPAGGQLYEGHCAIWIREFDWKRGCTVGEQRMIIDGGSDLSRQPKYLEGPHLYHIDGRYYLMAAEGGTETNHSEVIFSGESPFGPFKPCSINPILTQREQSKYRLYRVTSTGHADLVQTAEGEWYAVFLGVRPYKDDHDVMGRETFMLPVIWNDGQPVILPSGTDLAYKECAMPATPLWTTEGLAPDAFFIRTPQTDFYQIDPIGRLTLNAGSAALNEKKQPTAIGRWVTHMKFKAETSLRFIPEKEGDFAGMMLFHDDDNYACFGKGVDAYGRKCLKMTVYSEGICRKEDVQPLTASQTDKVWLYIAGDGDGYFTFHYSFAPDLEWKMFGEPVSADLFSTNIAGRFTGTMVGICATGNYSW